MRPSRSASWYTREALSSMKWGTFTIFTWLLWKNYIQLSGFLGGQSMMCLTFLRPDMRSCMKDTVQSFSGGRYTWATE